jgi:hypothetical protein
LNFGSWILGGGGGCDGAEGVSSGFEGAPDFKVVGLIGGLVAGDGFCAEGFCFVREGDIVFGVEEGVFEFFAEVLGGGDLGGFDSF